MQTAFDFLTVACFLGLVLVYFFRGEQNLDTLKHLMVSALCFAIANQLGNSGFAVFALALVAAGVGYAALVLRRS